MREVARVISGNRVSSQRSGPRFGPYADLGSREAHVGPALKLWHGRGRIRRLEEDQQKCTLAA